MALTVLDIKAGVRARGYETDTATEQLALINQVQRRWFGAHRWDAALVTATVAAVAGTASYALPTGVVHISSVRLAPAGGGNVVVPLRWEYPEQLRADLESVGPNTRGTPEFWAKTGPAAISLYPVPAQGGTLTVVYYQTCPILTADADVPLMPEAYIDIIICGVAEILAKRERQWEAAASFRDERKEIERDARAQLGISQMQTSNEVEQSGFYGVRGSY